MKIIWSPTARTKIKEILEYISEDNPDALLIKGHFIKWIDFLFVFKEIESLES